MILIIDIDETLVHSVRSNISPSIDRHDSKNNSNTFCIFDFIVYKRPYLDMFLDKVLNDNYYEVGIWSAGTYDYVHAIIDNIIPDKSKLKFIFTRDECDERDNKPLGKVRDYVRQIDKRSYNRTIHDFIIIDNKEGVTGFDHLNHLMIRDYEGDDMDCELDRLWDFLNKNRYRTSEYLVSNWQY